MRFKTNMGSTVRFLVALIFIQTFITSCRAGPLPNITNVEDGLNTDTCSVGDVVYSLNDDVPGSNACDRCKCSPGGVKCTQQTCEPRPGCKAVHRPDHCCPTYQCECEQEGRRYGNGEKLVDPHDSCRVCYCQGGEVVCRKIACFVRNDCKPRLVPGRCCPEYDNCPLRGVTTASSSAASSSESTDVDKSKDDSSTSAPQETKQQITIKEITPVSEIPAITEVKIKEIPSPSNEVGFSSSKSPQIPREATSEKSYSETKNEGEPSTQNVEPTFTSSPNLETKASQQESEVKADDNSPSKISFPTSDFTFNDTSDLKNEEITTNTPVTAVSTSTTTIKALIIEEEENPAFPPIPEDLAVLSNHGDEIVPETHMDADHVSSRHDYVSTSITSSTSTTTIPHQTTSRELVSEISSVPSTSTIVYETSTTERPKGTTKTPETTTTLVLTEKTKLITEAPKVVTKTQNITTEAPKISTEAQKVTTEATITTTESNKLTQVDFKPTSSSTSTDETHNIDTEEPILITEKKNITEPSFSQATETITESHQNMARSKLTTIVMSATDLTTSEPKPNQNTKKDSPLLNLRSAIPTEILNLPSAVPETIVEDDGKEEKSQSVDNLEESKDHIHLSDPNKNEAQINTYSEAIAAKGNKNSNVTKSDLDEKNILRLDSNKYPISEIPKFGEAKDSEQENLPTEGSLQTELSSFPIETSDPKPIETVESDVKADATVEPSSESPVKEKTKVSATSEPNQFMSSKFTETPTITFSNASVAVEVTQNRTITETKAAITEPTRKNVLKDFISLVGDVASISDEHEKEVTINTEKVVSSEQDEKTPMNASYKSKNSNFNQNSITETPEKSKTQNNKQKKVELEDHDDTTLSDGLPPNDKVEPTTKLPIIDEVSDEQQSKEKQEKKDIEIITRTYVPAINKRPSKVVVKKNDKSVTEEHNTEEISTAESMITSEFTSSSASLESTTKFQAPSVTEQSAQITASINNESTTVKYIESTTIKAEQATEQSLKTKIRKTTTLPETDSAQVLIESTTNAIETITVANQSTKTKVNQDIQ